jgi:hypothetical protein
VAKEALEDYDLAIAVGVIVGSAQQSTAADATGTVMQHSPIAQQRAISAELSRFSTRLPRQGPTGILRSRLVIMHAADGHAPRPLQHRTRSRADRHPPM